MTTEREKELIKLVKEDWECFGTLSKKDQTNAVIDTVLYKHPWCFRLIKSKKMKIYDRCFDAVNYDGMLLKYIPKKTQNNILVTRAVYKDAGAYAWIKNDTLKTFELSVDAVKRERLNINFVPKKLRKRVIDTLVSQLEKRISRRVGRKLTEKELEGIVTFYDVKT